MIGLSLRGVIDRIGGTGQALTEFAPAVAVVAGTVVLSRFLWIFGIDGLQAVWIRNCCAYIAPDNCMMNCCICWSTTLICRKSLRFMVEVPDLT